MSYLEHEYSAAALGVNEATLPSAVGGLDSNAIATNDCDLVTLHIFLDRTAATDIKFSVESYDRQEGTWHLEETVAIAAGVATYSDYVATKAASGDTYYVVKLDVEGTSLIRLADIYGTASTTDKITITAVARQVV